MHRAGIRTGSTLALLAVAWGLVTAFWLTVNLLVTAALGTRRVRRLVAVRRVLPVAAPPPLGPAPQPRADPGARIAPPPRLEIEPRPVQGPRRPPREFTGSDKEREAITRAVTAEAGHRGTRRVVEAHGQQPAGHVHPSEPPPARVSWDDVAAAVDALAAADELVFGPGKHAALVKASSSDSPHVPSPAGSGGGKSNLAAFLLAPGDAAAAPSIFNLDPKWISHLWVSGHARTSSTPTTSRISTWR